MGAVEVPVREYLGASVAGRDVGWSLLTTTTGIDAAVDGLGDSDLGTDTNTQSSLLVCLERRQPIVEAADGAAGLDVAFGTTPAPWGFRVAAAQVVERWNAEQPCWVHVAWPGLYADARTSDAQCGLRQRTATRRSRVVRYLSGGGQLVSLPRGVRTSSRWCRPRRVGRRGSGRRRRGSGRRRGRVRRRRRRTVGESVGSRSA